MKKHIQRTLLLVCLSALTIVSPAQDIVAVRRYIDTMMEQVRKEEMQAYKEDPILFAQENLQQTILWGGKYCTDSLAVIRLAGYKLINSAARAADNALIRQMSIMLLVQGAADNTGYVSEFISRALTKFSPDDFNREAITSLADIIMNQQPYPFNDYLRLAGYLGLESIQSFLQGTVNNQAEKEKNRWAANAALARMDRHSNIERCIRIYTSNNTDGATILNLSKDLIYTRQRACYDALIIELNSDDKKCRSANPYSSEKILCGYRIMEMLAPVIQNYPYQTIATGELDAKDYEKALLDVREWFRNNPDYKIINKGY